MRRAEFRTYLSQLRQRSAVYVTRVLQQYEHDGIEGHGTAGKHICSASGSV